MPHFIRRIGSGNMFKGDMPVAPAHARAEYAMSTAEIEDTLERAKQGEAI